MKKALKILGITLLALLTVAFAAPYLFKGKIVKLVKSSINESINAKVEFEDVDISLFRHFPKVAIGINNLSVVGIDAFANDTLLSANKLDVSLNFWSVVKGNEIGIYAIDIENPNIHTIINKYGDVNWDIMKPIVTDSTKKEDSKELKLKLDHYTIENGIFKFSDFEGNKFFSLENIQHAGKGDFNAAIFTLTTTTDVEKLSFSMNGIKFINDAKTKADIDLQVNTKESKYSFNTDKINLNNLNLATKGFFQIVNDSTYGMDIEFKAPSTDFKNLLSLIPAIYQNNFNSVKTSGEAIFNGFVKGNYNSIQLPAYQLNLQVKDGFFKYPDLPMPVNDVQVEMKIDNPDGIADHTIIDISKAHISMANEPFDFRLLIKNPISDLFVDAYAKGNLDLNKVTQFIKMPATNKLNGLLKADVAVKGSSLAIQKKQYDKFNASGSIDLNNFFYASKDYPDGVGLDNLKMTFNPKNVAINNVEGKFKETNFSANGYINNIFPYLFQNQALEGLLNVRGNQLNLNDFMGVQTDSTKPKSPESKPFLVPKNINLTLNAVLDKVHYDKLDLEQVTGSLLIADETVKLNTVKAKALNGDFTLTGYYSTKLDAVKPDIALNYNVTNVDVQKAFYAFNTMEKIMPIGKFLAGKISSQLSVTGKLGENMMPDLSSLTGNGNLLLIDGLLNKFKPVEKIAQTLSIKPLQEITLRDIKSYFEFTDGKVLVKPFKVKVKDIELEIGGTHSLNQILDYTINMKIPRALIGDNGNKLINNLTAKISEKGLPLNVSETLNLQLQLGGSISNPSVKTDLKQTTNTLAQDLKQQTSDFVQHKIDSTKQAVTSAIKDSFNSAKQQAINNIKNQAIHQIFNSKDSTKTDSTKNLEEAGKNLLKKINPFKKKEN